MTIKPEKADDDIDALEALESEEKEFTKVRDRARALRRLTRRLTGQTHRMPRLIESSRPSG
jgi:hypothetical protein